MEFFILAQGLDKNNTFAETEHPTADFEVGEPERCPVCKGAVSMLALLPPIKVKLTNGPLPDFVFGEITPFIVSDNFRREYSNSGLSGISSFQEVEMIKEVVEKSHPDSKYFLPQIIRSEARIDEDLSTLKRSGEVKCKECKKGSIIESFERLSLVPGTWTGEDIFYAKWLSGTVFATEKFMTFIHENRFSNAQHVRALEYTSQF